MKKIYLLIPLLLSFIILFKFIYVKYLNYVYEDVVFTCIANKYIKGRNDRETIENLAEYIAENITSDGCSHAPTNELAALLHGNGLCSVQSLIAAKLLKKAGLKSRLVHSKLHAFLEINIDGKWIVFEPFGGIVYVNDLGELLTYEELLSHIKNDKDFLIKRLGILSIQKSFPDKNEIFNYMNKLYTPVDYIYKYEIREDVDPTSGICFFIADINRFLLNYLGKWYARFIQMLYLSYLDGKISHYKETSYIETESPKTTGFISVNILNLFSNQDNLTNKELNESYDLLKARHHQLIEDYNEAEKIYKRLSRSSINYRHKLYSLYYYGFSLYKTKKYSEALEQFQTLIQIDKSESFKPKPVLYFMGRCYEEMGKVNMALNYYRKASLVSANSYSEFHFKRASMRASQIEKRMLIHKD
ncbi:tetratricopeptide repeat protein [Caedimonas varicaedens]|uniref:Tetratricopeptide repeat protein n=1 Tax=Caedimonas varicaedens TaxID=1629334 RepID=A0A0K8MDK9_9PROT|nr:tetratricopeptide repeat protein [Caedimonas varicaedens]